MIATPRHRLLVPGALSLLIFALALAACGGDDDGEAVRRRVVGSNRPHIPDVRGRLMVLGVTSLGTITGNRSDAASPFEETVTVGVPEGTETVIAVRQHVEFQAASTDETKWLDGCKTQGSCAGVSANPVEMELGMGLVDIYLEKLDKVTHMATLKVSMQLSNAKGDNKWLAGLEYLVLFLGRAPNVFVGPQGMKGDKGNPGMDGKNGMDGMAGSQGLPGVTGKAGPKGTSSLILGGGSGVLFSGATKLYEPLFSSGAGTSETQVQQPLPAPGKISNFSVRLSGVPGVALTFVVRRNGSATAVQCTVASGSTSCKDSVNSADFAAGDLVAIESSGSPSLGVKMNWTAKLALQ